MNSYYNDMFKKGEKYQEFVKESLYNMGLPIDFYTEKEDQYNKGETYQGVEIKFDDKYTETGNLYIEVAEKTDARNRRYIASGIYRKDNTWLYVIGNYAIIFLFEKKMLLKLHKSRNFLREVTTKTSKGFLLDKKRQLYALEIIKY